MNVFGFYKDAFLLQRLTSYTNQKAVPARGNSAVAYQGTFPTLRPALPPRQAEAVT